MNKKKNGVSSGDDGRTEVELPPIGEPVWVKFENFRTMAYRDDRGCWREVGTGKELKGVFEVLRED